MLQASKVMIAMKDEELKVSGARDVSKKTVGLKQA
jgi:hypothetical protein